MAGAPTTVSEVREVLDQFSTHRSLTFTMLVAKTGLPEPTVLACLHELEAADILVQCRGGTGVPVWKPR